MRIFRLEHNVTRLGPYKHRFNDDDYLDIINMALNTDHLTHPRDSRMMVTILEQYPKTIFGFSSLDNLLKFIKDAPVLVRYGFMIRVYETEPLYIHTDDQTLFIKPEFQ